MTAFGVTVTVEAPVVDLLSTKIPTLLEPEAVTAPEVLTTMFAVLLLSTKIPRPLVVVIVPVVEIVTDPLFDLITAIPSLSAPVDARAPLAEIVTAPEPASDTLIAFEVAVTAAAETSIVVPFALF